MQINYGLIFYIEQVLYIIYNLLNVALYKIKYKNQTKNKKQKTQMVAWSK